MDVLNQFKILPLIPINIAGWNISFTNSALFMVISALSIFLMSILPKYQLVPSALQSMNEKLYLFIHGLAYQYLGKDTDKYTPFLMSLFLFICLGNLLGLMPSSFTYTSHLAANFVLAGFVFVLAIIVGIRKHGLGIFKLFAPGSIPKVILPLIFVIELALFFIKPIVMSLRLCVNMIAGHVVLKVILGYIVQLGLLKFVPILGYSTMILFECAVAIFQAYIFVLLSCIFLKDILHLH